MDATTALAIYRAEKDKALRERRVSHVQLMAEAQEAFRKMLADAQLARKGGRPKGSTNAASATPSAAVVATQTVTVSTSKLVLKPTKTAPPKAPEKVTAPVDVSMKPRTAPRKAATKAVATKVEKRSTEKRHAPAKSRPAAKAAKRASASARKGSAKKAAAPRKQAAARERKAKSRKR